MKHDDKIYCVIGKDLVTRELVNKSMGREPVWRLDKEEALLVFSQWDEIPLEVRKTVMRREEAKKLVRTEPWDPNFNVGKEV